jgi:hypothetical protein
MASENCHRESKNIEKWFCFSPSLGPPTPRGVESGIASFAFHPYFHAMSVQELESAVTRLSAEELARFHQWFEEYVADQWDRQIEADSRAGRFDAAGKRAVTDLEGGRCKPL